MMTQQPILWLPLTGDLLTRGGLGSGAATFARSGSRSYIDSSLGLSTVTANNPRYDYSNGIGLNGSKLFGSILIEPALTNLILNSDSFTSDSLVNVTISSNAANGPDGTLIADKMVENTVNNQHRSDQTITFTSQNYCFSAFVKAVERSFVQLRIGSTGSVIGPGSLRDRYIVQSPYTGSLKLANGWYRIWTASNPGSNTPVRVNMADNTGNAAYLGDNASGLLIVGRQVETGIHPSSYIASTGSQGTASADTLTFPVSNSGYNNIDYNGGIINLWVCSLRYGPSGTTRYLFDTRDSSGNGGIAIWIDSSNNLNGAVYGQGGAYKGESIPLTVNNALPYWHNISFEYNKYGYCKLYLDGTIRGTFISSGSWSDLASIDGVINIGHDSSNVNQYGGNLAHLRVFDKKVPIKRTFHYELFRQGLIL